MGKDSKFEIGNWKLDKIIFFFYSSLFLFTPLIMTAATSELFEFNKMIFIYLITIFIVFFWITKMMYFKKIIIKKTPFDIPIILFLSSQVTSTFFSIDRHTSIFGYYGRFNGGLLSIITYIILFYGFISNLSGRQVLDKLLKISLISSFIVILWGLPGKVGHDMTCFLFMGQFNNSCWTEQFRPAERMFSTLGQPNWLGAYLAINFFTAIYFFYRSFKNKKLIASLFYCFIVVLIFTGIIFTRSRSALLAVGIGVGLGVATIFLRWLREKNRLFFYLLITILVISTIFIGETFIKKQWSNLTITQSSVTESFNIRKIVWKGAINLGLKYPLFGTGVETFAYSYYFVRPQEHNLTSEWDYLYNKAHNEYLNYLATTGFVGLGSYLIMIGAVVFLAIKKILNIKNQKEKNNNKPIKQEDNETILILSFLLAYISILITNFFGFSTTTINLFFYLIPAFLLVKTDDYQIKEEAINRAHFQLSLFQKFNIILLLFAICYLLFTIFKYWYADTLYAKGDQASKVGEYQLSANLFNQALKYKYEHVYEDKLSYALANLAAFASYQKENELAKKLIILSQLYNQKSLSSSPKNVLYWKTKAKIYYLFYQITLNKDDLQIGIDALKQAKIISPTDPKIPYYLAVFYSLMVDETKDKEEKLNFQNLSIKMINQAINLKSDYRDGYFLKGQLLKKYGQKEEAGKTFQFILDKINPRDEEVKKELQSI